MAFWKLTPQQLKEQVDHYSALGLSESSRKFAALVWAIGDSMAVISLINSSTAVVQFLVIVFLGSLIYSGYRFAIIFAMIQWTAQIAVTISSNPDQSLIWVVVWFGVLIILDKARQVEAERRKQSISITEDTKS